METDERKTEMRGRGGRDKTGTQTQAESLRDDPREKGRRRVGDENSREEIKGNEHDSLAA